MICEGTDVGYIFADDFESGELLAWTGGRVRDDGDLRAREAARLAGNYGLLAEIDDEAMLFVADEHPVGETRYIARFYFDPNSIRMAKGDAHQIFRGFTGKWPAVVEIALRYNDYGKFQVRAGLLNDSTTWRVGLWHTISDAPHFFEIDWRAATAPGANDGAISFYIDGTLHSKLSGIDNDTRRIDRVHLGAISGIDSGTRGIYYFDAFVSQRTGMIGPAATMAVAVDAEAVPEADVYAWSEEEMAPGDMPAAELEQTSRLFVPWVMP
jgi:hypothetical protein